MDHVAIMKKSWGLLPKILSGEKQIESRWYLNKSAPWGRISRGDMVYFKDSGSPITVVARVSRVLRFSDLTPARVGEILREYGAADGIATKDIPKYHALFRSKRYCMLIFLEDAAPMEPPFDIDKRGFGSMAAWLCVEDISRVKKSTTEKD